MTVLFVPSKNRPMQLDATLRSFYFSCEDNNRIEKFVLYKAEGEDYENAYKTLSKEYTDVNFIKENNFKEDLIALTFGHKYILFSVDDTIFVNNFNLLDMENKMYNDNDVISFSLRLGTNTHYCYPENKKMNIPMINFYNDIGYFDWTKEEMDFGYPADISSSLHFANNFNEVFYDQNYNNPNELEWLMHVHSMHNKWLINKKYMLCYETSRAFSSPVNKVQTVNNNRSGTKEKYSEGQLLKVFLSGYRIDIEKFDEYVPNACHEEVDFEFININNN